MNSSLSAREVIFGRNNERKLFVACTICSETLQLHDQVWVQDNLDFLNYGKINTRGISFGPKYEPFSAKS